ncbi:TspO/MBR family protein [Persicobacter psychrovividus]|uniref:Tryptophan-rich sensory protein n=1 Tax=Persicobacter psychrovividus TaxID=387638 RepID=A0ABM7VL03_9BACT|nr:hypothetical protein PEPS_39590 [Persicobacter psychrovividus]
MWVRIIFFLIINFMALGIGGQFTAAGVASDWYARLPKAPWTPPSWMFGVAWSTIMVLLAIFMSRAMAHPTMRTAFIILFTVQWILNVAWNPLFFEFHWLGFALLDIVLLSVTVGVMLWLAANTMGAVALLILPYFIWLLIACSLNAYSLMQVMEKQT